MPFKNYEYSGERLFPVSTNNSDFTFRAWVSNSTSIDRVFTVSHNKDLGYQGKLLEVQSNTIGKNKKDKTSFRQMNIIPNSGFEKFILKADSLNLMDVKDQEEKDFPVALHQPFSLYVIEIKNNGKTHLFRFNTYFPYKEKVGSIYESIQNLIFNEFDIKFYFKNQK